MRLFSIRPLPSTTPDPTPQRCPIPTTALPTCSTTPGISSWIPSSAPIVTSAVSSNLQVTTTVEVSILLVTVCSMSEQESVDGACHLLLPTPCSRRRSVDSLLVAQALLAGPRRFNELLDEIQGIAPNILSQRLKRLERDAILVSRPISSASPRRLRADCGGHGTRGGASLAGALGVPACTPRRSTSAPDAVRLSKLGGIARRVTSFSRTSPIRGCNSSKARTGDRAG